VYEQYGVDYFLKQIWEEWLSQQEVVRNAFTGIEHVIELQFRFIQADMLARCEMYHLPTAFSSQHRWCHVCEADR
jgi:hypothetical protein